MSKKSIRLSGNRLRLAARMVESPIAGGPVREAVMQQLGLELLREAEISRDEPPALRPCFSFGGTHPCGGHGHPEEEPSS